MTLSSKSKTKSVGVHVPVRNNWNQQCLRGENWVGVGVGVGNPRTPHPHYETLQVRNPLPFSESITSDDLYKVDSEIGVSHTYASQIFAFTLVTSILVSGLCSCCFFCHYFPPYTCSKMGAVWEYVSMKKEMTTSLCKLALVILGSGMLIGCF